MSMRKTKEAKIDKILGLCFGAVGLGMVAVGIIMAMITINFINRAEEVRGIVTETGNGTQVLYSYEGVEYEEWVSVTGSAIHVGDGIKIYVDRENPHNIKISDYIFLVTYILGGIGLLFLLIGVGFLLALYCRTNKKKALMTKGKKLYAEITGGSVNYTYSVNGRHPFRMECRYTDPFNGAVYLYSSGNTWIDPNLYIGRQVAVYVDNADFSKYYVDIESLSALGADGVDASNVYDFRK